MDYVDGVDIIFVEVDPALQYFAAATKINFHLNLACPRAVKYEGSLSPSKTIPSSSRITRPQKEKRSALWACQKPEQS